MLFIQYHKNKDFFEANWLHHLNLIPIELLIINYLFCLLLFAQSHIIDGAIAFTSITARRIKCHQMTEMLYWNNIMKYIQFRRLYTKNIVHLCQAGRLFGTKFVIFIIVNIPINITMINILRTRRDFIFILFSSFIFLQQFLCIVGIHILVANINQKNFLVCATFMKLFVPNNCKFQKRTNLKLNFFIQTFFTKKLYGYSYGNLALISMMTFMKVLKDYVFGIFYESEICSF